MDINEKKRLALTGQMSQEACAVRLNAAFMIYGKKQIDLAEQVKQGKTSINNQLKGRQFPSREVLAYFFEEYRIDFNFFYAGLFAQLPGDVQDQLFAALKDAS